MNNSHRTRTRRPPPSEQHAPLPFTVEGEPQRYTYMQQEQEQVYCPGCLLVLMMTTPGLAQDLAIPDDPSFRVLQMLALVSETTTLDPSDLPTPLADDDALGTVCCSCNRILVAGASVAVEGGGGS